MDVIAPFRHPLVLLALLIPALLLYWTWSRKGRALVLPLDHASAPRGSWIRACVGTAESLPSLFLGLVVLILAGPQRWDEPESKKVLTNIEFCVDVSGSMNSSFGGSGTRYDASMAAINDFLDYREGDAFGLTFFGNEVLHWVPLTTDTSAFRCAPPFMKPGQLPRWFNGTSIGKALLACRRVLTSREEGDRMIVLVSDGFSSDLRGDRAKEIAKQLRDERITVYAVIIMNSSPPDEIVQITSITGGEVFEPGDEDGMRRVFQRIDEMQATRIERASADAVDNYEDLALVCLCVVGGCLLTLFGLRYTPW